MDFQVQMKLALMTNRSALQKLQDSIDEHRAAMSATEKADMKHIYVAESLVTELLKLTGDSLPQQLNESAPRRTTLKQELAQAKKRLQHSKMTLTVEIAAVQDNLSSSRDPDSAMAEVIEDAEKMIEPIDRTLGHLQDACHGQQDESIHQSLKLRSRQDEGSAGPSTVSHSAVPPTNTPIHRTEKRPGFFEGVFHPQGTTTGR